MRNRILVLIITVALLAACGTDDTPSAVLTPTPTPTLTTAERITFDPGTIQNPLRMVIVPQGTVAERVHLITSTLLEQPASQINGETLLELADNADLLEQFGVFLNRDFGVEITAEDATAITTLADLIQMVEAAVADQAEAALFEFTRLNFELVIAENYGQGLTALCESNSGLVSMAWLDGITYFAAQALNCSEPSQQDLQIAIAEQRELEFGDVDFVPVEPTLEVTPEMTGEADAEATGDGDATPTPTLEPTRVPQQDTRPRTSGELLTSEVGLLIINSEIGVASTQAISTRVFCRVSVTDFFSWFVPSLMMERDNVRPDSVLEFDDPNRIARAVRDGDCAAAVLSQSEFDTLSTNIQESLAIAETTPGFPYGVLMYPLDVQLGERVNLSENLPLLAADDAASRPLRLLLGQDAFLPAEPGSFADLEAFIITTGVDLAQLGR